MTDDTIVAVFDTQAHASAAVRDLENAGVPASAITQHAKGGITPAPRRSPPLGRARRVSGRVCSAARPIPARRGCL